MKLPVTDPAHERVEVPDVVVVVRVILVGLRVHVSPVEGEMVSDNATVPVKPFVADTAIADVPEEPTTKLTLPGLAVTVKLGAGLTLYATVAE